MIQLCLVALLSAAPAPALKLAATPFRGAELPAGRGALYAEHLATRLLERGVKVSTQRDIATVLGLEREKQLLGCADGSNCLVELAGALGVDAVLTGEVAKLESGFLLVVKVLGASDAAVRFARSAQVANEGELFSTLDAWAGQIAGEAPARSVAPLVPIAVGAAGVAVGAGFLVSAGLAWRGLGLREGAALSLDDATAARAWGQQAQTVGVVLVGVGAAAVVAGVLWRVAGAPKERPATVWLVPNGQGVSLVGVFE